MKVNFQWIIWPFLLYLNSWQKKLRCRHWFRSMGFFFLSLIFLLVIVFFFLPLLFAWTLWPPHPTPCYPIILLLQNSCLLPTLLSFHFISPPLLPLIPLHIYSAQKLPHFSALLSYPVILSSCSPHLSIPPPFFPPTLSVPSATPPFFFRALLPSPLQKATLISSAEILSQGRDQPQPISHMTECAVCQWCMYAARGGAADG